jgi:soluble lytic murein transglycosylase-like protein
MRASVLAGAILLLIAPAVAAAAVKHARPQPVRHAAAHATKRPAPHPAKQAARAAPPAPQRSVFAQEQAMSPTQLIKRWSGNVQGAAHRFNVPVLWINAVMRMESGGRTMLSEGQPMVSDRGALGLMQVLPGTYDEMRQQYKLGPDPFRPHDNIMAGAAYLRWLKGKYAYPALFAAYNAGPQRVDDLLAHGTALPAETQAYLTGINKILGGNGGRDGSSILAVNLTRPDGSPVKVDPVAVLAVREAFAGEYPDNVKAVLRFDRRSQAVTEDIAAVTRAVREHGGHI